MDYKYCKEVEENEAQGSYIEYDQGEGKSQEKKNKLMSITYNNFAWYFKK